MLDQYSELQFDEIATSDESWAGYVIESDSMSAHRPEEVIPRLRPGILINRIMITSFFTARELIALDALPKGQKCNQEYFAQNILLSVLDEKKRFSRQKAAIKFYVHMDNSMCHNDYQVVDELYRLKIFKVFRPPYSPDINPGNVLILGDLKGKLK
jgi:hypothetical protein